MGAKLTWSTTKLSLPLHHDILEADILIIAQKTNNITMTITDDMQRVLNQMDGAFFMF